MGDRQQVTAAQENLRERLLNETPFWAGGMNRDHGGRWQPPAPSAAFQGCAKIVDKDKRLVPLIAHPWQLELDEKLESQRAAGLPMRAIILKARQLGFSTWVEARITQRVTQLPHQSAVVVAQDVKTAGRIFDMARVIYDNLPSEEELGVRVKPRLLNHSNSPNGRKFLEFGERYSGAGERMWSSILDIDTAGAPEAGRGTTRNMAHLTEVALWPDSATAGTGSKMISIMNSVGYRPETLIVLESTANGLNHFYRRWVSARDGQADPDTGETYQTLFVPWWRDPEYVREFPTPEARERFTEGIGTGPYGDDEQWLTEEFNCTAEQLWWRRMQIRTQHEDNVEYFKQEYPASDEEAFIGSGHTVFSSILVSRAIRATDDYSGPVAVGSLRGLAHKTVKTRNGTVEVPTKVAWIPDEFAARGEPRLTVYEHPLTEEAIEGLPAAQRGTKPGIYVVAADVAEGKVNTFTEGDYHAIQVFDHRTRKQVAVHESRMDLHDVPLWCLLIAIYYNTAILAPEVNGPGIAVVDTLAKDYHYPLYRRRNSGDSSQNKVEHRLGFKTDRVTKPQIELGFGEALREDTHGLRHARTARQLSTYVADEQGRHGALDGEHDDLLMAAMIAHRVMDVTRIIEQVKGRRTRRVVADSVTGY